MRIPLRDHQDSRVVIAPAAAVTAIGVMLVVLAATVAAVVFGVRDNAENSVVEANRTTLRAQAGEIVATVFSVDASRWEADRARARSVIGGEFADSFAAQLRRPPEAGVTAVRWQVVTVALIDVGTDTGQTLIRADVTTRPEQGGATTEGRTVRAGFQLLDTHWVMTSAEVIT